MTLPYDGVSTDTLSAHAVTGVLIKGLRRRAMAWTHDPCLAEDVVQDSLQRMVAALRAGRPVRDLRAYAHAILGNVRRDAMAARRREDRLFVSIDEWGDERDGERAAAPRQLRKLELLEILRLVATLPAEQRAIVTLVAGGRSYKEIAAMLGLPMGTVMSRLNRAREALRAMVDRRGRARRRVSLS